MTRLPSFNDFSPTIIGDIRPCLQIVSDLSPDFDAIVSKWDKKYFGAKNNKRARINLTATLSSTGLFDRKAVKLTDVGERVLAQPTASEAAAEFCKHIIQNLSGLRVIEAIKNLNMRGERISKDSLKAELVALGVTDLSTGTTDHTTLRNWMVFAGILQDESSDFKVNDAVLKRLIGASGTDLDEISELTVAQRFFVQVLRRMQEASGGTEIWAKDVNEECLRNYRGVFDDDQLRIKVFDPLVKAGWIEASGLTSGRGSKSGKLKATDKLLNIPLSFFIAGFDEAVPPDLRKKINTPLGQIQKLLEDPTKHNRGVGLELLALRMILDLGLEPRGFRVRSRETAFAEVDVTAEGRLLLFSRWNFQCKNVTANVGLADVAKEVGIAIYARAHVIAMVTTSNFSADALEYARQVSLSTHLQFVFIAKGEIKAYLKGGASRLVEHVMNNAARVMLEKKAQPITPLPGVA